MISKETNKKEKLFDALSPTEKMKLEIAEELGLLEKVQKGGWRALSAKETGCIGGRIANRKRELKQKAEQEGEQ